MTPAELRNEFSRLGWRRVSHFKLATLCTVPDQELTPRAKGRGQLLLHPSVGMIKPGDVIISRACVAISADANIRRNRECSPCFRCDAHGGRAKAIWHAIIRKNHGCSHFTLSPRPRRTGKRREW